MGRKKEEKLLSEWYMYQRGWLMFFFFLSFSFLDDFFFGLWFLTVALLAWRVVFFFFFGGHWVGVGVIYNMGESFALDWTTLQVHVT